MEGTITVDSKENLGSTFTFVLPSKVPLEQDLSDDPDESLTVSHSGLTPNPLEGFFLFKPKTVHKSKPPDSSHFKQTCSVEVDIKKNGKSRPMRQSSGLVLLVEDNKVNIMVAKSMVEQLGHSVCVVNNGLEAIRAVQQTRFDLILMVSMLSLNLDKVEVIANFCNLLHYLSFFFLQSSLMPFIANILFFVVVLVNSIVHFHICNLQSIYGLLHMKFKVYVLRIDNLVLKLYQDLTFDSSKLN
jgi:hypothetical protein